MGCSVTTATSRISVSPAIRMSSAISFGVFCRLAPSTRAIIRSRNVWPGSEVIWTTIRSDSTTVPPVTALRSPPDSRITGAGRGTDVVVGFVECHGRRLTQDMIDGLEVVPRKEVEYRGSRLEEMDLDAVLSRWPEV